jgi:hypothetical protein
MNAYHEARSRLLLSLQPTHFPGTNMKLTISKEEKKKLKKLKHHSWFPFHVALVFPCLSGKRKRFKKKWWNWNWKNFDCTVTKFSFLNSETRFEGNQRIDERRRNSKIFFHFYKLYKIKNKEGILQNCLE